MIAGEVISLSGSAEDSTLPGEESPGVEWTVISGPGTVAFADVSDAATTAVFPQPGTYRLRLTADQGTMRTFEEKTVTVEPAAPPPTLEAWLEIHYGPDHSKDPDTDTVPKAGVPVTLREAFLMGDDPHDPQDVLRVEATGGGAFVFETLPGHAYRIEISEDLQQWQLHEQWEAGVEKEAGTTEFNLPLSSGPRFFRLLVEFPDTP